LTSTLSPCSQRRKNGSPNSAVYRGFAKDTATVKVSFSRLSDPTDSVKTRRVSFTHMQDLFRLEK